MCSCFFVSVHYQDSKGHLLLPCKLSSISSELTLSQSSHLSHLQSRWPSHFPQLGLGDMGGIPVKCNNQGRYWLKLPFAVRSQGLNFSDVFFQVFKLPPVIRKGGSLLSLCVCPVSKCRCPTIPRMPGLQNSLSLCLNRAEFRLCMDLSLSYCKHLE